MTDVISRGLERKRLEARSWAQVGWVRKLRGLRFDVFVKEMNFGIYVFVKDAEPWDLYIACYTHDYINNLHLKREQIRA